MHSESRTTRCNLNIGFTPLLAGVILNFSDFFPRAACSLRTYSRRGPEKQIARAQLTKRRMRTFITKPSAKNTNNVAEPP